MANATTEPIDIAATPAPEPDGLYEVIDGQIVEKPPLSAYGSDIATILAIHMGNSIAAHQLGKVQVAMLFLIDRDRGLKRRPDVSFVSRERWPIRRKVPRTAAWDVVPDLAVEVVSPTNTAAAVLIKVGEYFRAGVRLVWVVYPDPGHIYAYTSPTAVTILATGDDLDGGTVVPGFRLPVAVLFEGEDEPGPAPDQT